MELLSRVVEKKSAFEEGGKKSGTFPRKSGYLLHWIDTFAVAIAFEPEGNDGTLLIWVKRYNFSVVHSSWRDLREAAECESRSIWFRLSGFYSGSNGFAGSSSQFPGSLSLQDPIARRLEPSTPDLFESDYFGTGAAKPATASFLAPMVPPQRACRAI
jgi:hypothetical protein